MRALHAHTRRPLPATLADGLHPVAARLGLILIVGALGTGLIGAAVAAETVPARQTAAAAQPFAVLELFTSEGCSSCPPADQLLGQIVESARAKGSRIYPLAFHVDYWDRLGWRDPFSDPAFSERQYAYAKVIPGHRVYTPQLIVNGRMAFVGSDAAKTQAAIDTSLMRPATLGLELRLEPTHSAANDAPSTRGKSLTVNYRIHEQGKDIPPGAVLNVVLVERDLASNVLRGENAGRRLTHENVVRAFRTIPLNGSSIGDFPVAAPENLRRDNSSIIAYIQDPTTMAVLGAGEADVAPVSSMPGR